MSAAPSQAWPGGRVLAGWRPLLDRWQPHALHLHHLLLHHVEATVLVSRSPDLERLYLLLLRAIDRGRALDELVAELSLEPAFLRRLLSELHTANLAAEDPSSGVWSPTRSGRLVLAGGHPAATQHERRSFYFVEGDRHHPGTRYLALDNPPAPPWPATEGWHFDVATLRDCIARPEEWKRGRGFPADVRGLPAPSENGVGMILDRAEHLMCLFVLAGADGPWHALAVQPATWQVQADHPVMTLGDDWREALPELADEPDVEEWRQAWRSWGQPRGLPPGELEACHLERSGMKLLVRAPRPLLERLHTSRSDAVRGEAWLLAGSGERTRTAAVIELGEEL